MSSGAVEILKNLVEAILEGTDCGAEIDAGCNGEGPLAEAMVYLGLASDLDEATDKIYEGRDYDGFNPDSEENEDD